MVAEKVELVFIPIPGMGHMPSMVELARRLVAHSPGRISITFLIMRFSTLDNKIDSFIQSLKPSSSNTCASGKTDDADKGHITFLELPFPENPPSMDSKHFAMLMLDAYKPIIKQIFLQKQMHQQQRLMNSPTQKADRHLGGFILDMTCTTMIDVANELGIPSYLFFTSGASFLRMMLHFVYFGAPDIAVDLNDSQQSAVDEVTVAGFKNPVPTKVWPDMFLDVAAAETRRGMAGRYREAKGILVNTFVELEPHFIQSLSSPDEHEGIFIPPIYPVGPIINLKDESLNNSEQKDTIMSWLDSQPTHSVLFLCFGSRGVFNETQLKEIATGLERSGHRFLWSLRRNTAWSTGSDGEGEDYSESEYLQQVLPEGFLARIAGFGRVIGWAPQVSVLGHQAVGAFMSHCGWNSILEGTWFGVPLLTWPMYTEQQLNAFALVHELGMAVEIRIDYKCNPRGEANMLVEAAEIEKGIKKVMDTKEEGSSLREKVKRISEMGQKAFLEKSGSSYQAMGLFVDDVFKNLS